VHCKRKKSRKEFFIIVGHMDLRLESERGSGHGNVQREACNSEDLLPDPIAEARLTLTDLSPRSIPTNGARSWFWPRLTFTSYVLIAQDIPPPLKSWSNHHQNRVTGGGYSYQSYKANRLSWQAALIFCRATCTVSAFVKGKKERREIGLLTIISHGVILRSTRAMSIWQR